MNADVLPKFVNVAIVFLWKEDERLLATRYGMSRSLNHISSWFHHVFISGGIAAIAATRYTHAAPALRTLMRRLETYVGLDCAPEGVHDTSNAFAMLIKCNVTKPTIRHL